MPAVFYGDVLRAAAEFRLVIAATAALAVLRAVPFLVPGVRFDADQAVVGLMAKHISEGRAFPVFFYGQSYLLALEAYLATPVMWLLGPTELALKLPLVAMNAAAAMLTAWIAHRDLGLRPWLAGVCALPLAVPPIVAGTRLMEAMGGSAELPLYAVLLWAVRGRPWTFALLAALAVNHREFAAYSLLALAAIEAMRGGLWTSAGLGRWSLAGLACVMARSTFAALRPFGAMFGPGTTARPVDLDISSGLAVSAQVCLDPSRWSSRFGALVSEHLPLLVGGAPGPLTDAGVTTGVGQGNPGLAVWVAGLTVAALGLAIWHRRPAGAVANGDRSVAPAGDFGWYLSATGALSILVYWLVACSQISVESIRYDLLALLVPVGAVLVGMQHAGPPGRAGLATAVVIWLGLAATDYLALAREVASGRYPDYRGQAAAALEARGITTLWGEFRLAHVLTFRAQERVIVGAINRERIELYTARARAAHGPLVTMAPCPDGRGEVLVPGINLCPPP